MIHLGRHEHPHEPYGYLVKVSAWVELLLLAIFKNKSNFHGSITTHALLMSTYSALCFSLSATLSGLILTNKFGQFTVWASLEKDPIQWGHGSKCSWIWMMRHCECSVSIIWSRPPHLQIADLVSLIAGTVSMIAQVLLYGWLQESVFVKGILTIIVAFGVLFLGRLIRLLLRLIG